MEDHGECMLVLIGATPEGKKELIGFQVGVRESAQSWREFLVEVKSRGLTIAPEIAAVTGARLLEGARRGLSRHAASAVLGAQDRQRLEQSQPLGADQHEEGSARNLFGAEPGFGQGRSTSSPRNTERNTTRRSSA